MKKKACILACLLVSSIYGGGFAQMSIANPGGSESNTQSVDIPASGGDLSNLILTLQDLPPGFTEVSTLKDQLQNSPIKAASVFAYQKNDDEQFLLLTGFTTELTNQIDRAKFDADIREGNFAKGFSKSFNNHKESKFTDASPLTLKHNIGDVSAGWTIQGKIRGIPMNADMVMLRRGKIGAFIAILYLDGSKPTITISEAARKLDNRMMELKPDLTKQ
jgi:hypothetical protein